MNGWRGTAFVILVVLPAVLAVPSGARSEDAAPQSAIAPAPVGLEGLPPEKRALADRIRKRVLCACPTCPKVNPGDCAPGCGPAAQQLQEIRALVEAGRNEEEAVRWFVETYGERILAAPPMKGLSVVAWLAPFGVLLLGGAGLAVYLWRASVRRGPPASTPSRAGEEDRHARVARDLDPFG